MCSISSVQHVCSEVCAFDSGVQFWHLKWLDLISFWRHLCRMLLTGGCSICSWKLGVHDLRMLNLKASLI